MTSNDPESGQDARSIRPSRPIGETLENLVLRFGLSSDASKAELHTRATGTTLDSRDVRPGDLYLALAGARRHGAEFAAQVEEKGAAAILTDQAGAELTRAAGVQVPVLVAPGDPRAIAGVVSAAVYATANLDAKVFGITGTNGKTSIVYLLAELMRAAGLKTGLSSTAERRVGDTVITSSLTSPEAPELHGLLARMIEQQVEGIALEVSAHATARHRIDGVNFDVVAFNNFSRDHLDDFGDMETYFAAKLALFAPEHAKQAVVVVDGPFGQRIARESKVPVTTLATEYGVNADWHLAITHQNLDGVSFALQGPGGAHFRGSVPVFGRFMAENAALALIMLHQAGISLDRVAAGLNAGRIPVYIPGRLEAMNPTAPLDRSARFYVDYGHTPGSFEATLAALCGTTMEVVPHIVIGLHYGRILGEANALDIVSRHRVHSLVLVVVMPFYAKPGTFATPATADVGRVFLEARARIADREVLLGCARPPGMHRRVTDAYAVAAGLDGIAFPADGTLAVAQMLGRPAAQEHACCSIKTGRTIELGRRIPIVAVP